MCLWFDFPASSSTSSIGTVTECISTLNIDDALGKSSHKITLITYGPYHPTDMFIVVSFIPVNGGARHLRFCVSFLN